MMARGGRGKASQRLNPNQITRNETDPKGPVFCFEINFGSCGSHELLPQQTAGSFASFFIGIGKLHADTSFLSWLKDISFGYADRCKELRNEYNSLNERLENTLNI